MPLLRILLSSRPISRRITRPRTLTSWSNRTAIPRTRLPAATSTSRLQTQDRIRRRPTATRHQTRTNLRRRRNRIRHEPPRMSVMTRTATTLRRLLRTTILQADRTLINGKRTSVTATRRTTNSRAQQPTMSQNESADLSPNTFTIYEQKVIHRSKVTFLVEITVHMLMYTSAKESYFTRSLFLCFSISNFTLKKLLLGSSYRIYQRRICGQRRTSFWIRI